MALAWDETGQVDCAREGKRFRQSDLKTCRCCVRELNWILLAAAMEGKWLRGLCQVKRASSAAHNSAQSSPAKCTWWMAKSV